MYIFALFSIVHFFSITSSCEKIIKTTNGPVIGHLLKGFSRPVVEYLGIPFAQPPVGNLRFQPPKEIKKPIWKEAYHANKKAKTCMQPIIITNFSLMDLNNPKHEELSEDCLQLNIWVPKNKKDSVIVFIYGGTFIKGSASRYAYNGSALADKSRSIVITINYRLGFLGFAYLKNSSIISGNMGLLDQQMALKWIYKNIKKFGGNPKKITLYGHSAGSVSATAHLFADGSKKYFRRLIASSGVISAFWSTVDSEIADENTKNVAKLVNCSSNDIDEMAKCLIKTPYNVLIGPSLSISNIKQPPVPNLFMPVENDKLFFRGSFKKKYKDGNFKNDSELIIGRNKNEATYYMTSLLGEIFGCGFFPFKDPDGPENQCNITSTTFSGIAMIVGKVIGITGLNVFKLINLYNDKKLSTPREKAEKLLSEVLFVCDIGTFAEYYASHSTKNIYFYEFRQRSVLNKYPKWMGVMHEEDLGPTFGIPFLLPKWYKNSKQHYFEKVFSTNLMMYLGRFANNGYPKKFWKKYKAKEGLGLVIDKNLVVKGKKKVHVSTYNERCTKLRELAKHF